MDKAIYGLLACFQSPEELLEAAHRVRSEGYRCLDAYTPFAVDGLSEALGFEHDGIAALAFCGGAGGGAGAYFMQYFANVIDYPLNIGGRPHNSWPAFVPVTFELTVLGAAFTAVIGMLLLNGFPRPHHPVFGAPGFTLATGDQFYLCIEARDPLFDRRRTRADLERVNPRSIEEIMK